MIGDTFVQEIKRIYNGKKNQLVKVNQNDVQGEINLFHADQYAFIVNSLLIYDKKKPENQHLVSKQLDFIQNRVTYLYERIRLVEWDKQANQALLRSEKPSEYEDRKHYYEVFLDAGNRILLKRFSFVYMEQNRIMITYTISDEILIRLFNDFVECLYLKEEKPIT